MLAIYSISFTEAQGIPKCALPKDLCQLWNAEIKGCIYLYRRNIKIIQCIAEHILAELCCHLPICFAGLYEISGLTDHHILTIIIISTTPEIWQSIHSSILPAIFFSLPEKVKGQIRERSLDWTWMIERFLLISFQDVAFHCKTINNNSIILIKTIQNCIGFLSKTFFFG